MSEWRTCKLSDIAEVIDSMHQTPKYSAVGKPLVRVTDLKNGYLNLKDCLRVTEEVYKAYSSRHKSQKGDIVFARVGSYGNLGFVNKPMEFCLGQNTAFIIPKEDATYLYYYLKSPLGEYEIEASVGGSTQPTVSIKSIKNFEVLLPPLPEQKAIASVLSSLDDKIDLLHRQNKTLEAMAETLFRQWFIEEAKEDWEEGVLEQLIDLKYGKALKQEDRSGSGYPVVASSGIVGFHKDYLVQAPGIVIGRKGTLGKVYFMENNFYPIDTSYFIQTKTSGSNLIFEYYLLKSLDFANMNSDSAVPGLNRNIALGTQIQVPPEELILSFNETAQSWFSKIHLNTKQIQTLENLRDTLLPKLISGEVRVMY